VALREYADMLDTWAEAMATSYAAKTGGDKGRDSRDAAWTARTTGTPRSRPWRPSLVDAVISALPVAASANLDSLIKARFASFPQPTTPAASVAPTPSYPS
jgi:hypothetical protein